MEQKFIIIDRTIPEILKRKKNASKDELIQFCRILKNLGADIIEIDKTFMDTVQELIEDIKFIYRAEGIRSVLVGDEALSKNTALTEDEIIMKEHKFYGVITDKIEILQHLIVYNSENNRNQRIIFELPLDNIEELSNWFFNAKDMDFSKIFCIRVKGIGRNIPWISSPDLNVLKEAYSVKIDICPEDEYYCATAVSLEALEKGADFITASFCGRGGKTGFAALEEVIMSLKILYKLNLRIEPAFFSLAKALYENLTKEAIPGQKPILGEDIFKCESGIHVDGLIKNPELYEPYDPELVGLKREIILGKHSGSAAIIGRLSNLNLDLEGIDISSILDALREKSLNIKGQVSDEDLKNIIESYLKEKSAGTQQKDNNLRG